MTDIVFLLLAGTSVGSALLLVTRRNPIYASLCMLVLFVSTALLFLQLAAPFLAAMQVVVYGGAVLMLFLFIIMMLNLHPEELGGEKGLTFKISAGILATVLAIFLGYAIKRSAGIVHSKAFFADPGSLTTPLGDIYAFGTTEYVGDQIFSGFVLPFELVSVLVVAAIAGAVVLTKKKL